MQDMMDEEQKKKQENASSTQPVSSTPKAPGLTPASTRQPAWASSLSPGGQFDLGPSFVEKMMAEEEKPVRIWLDTNIDKLRNLSLPALVQRVLEHVPEAKSLPAIQLQATIRRWATERNVSIPAISLIPVVGSDIPSRTSGPPSAMSDFVTGVRKTFGSIPTNVKVEDEHGKFVIDTSGAAIDLRGGKFTIGEKMEWGGKVSTKASFGNLSFEASLTSKEWRMKVSFAAGSSEVESFSLDRIFKAGEEGLRGIQEEISKGVNPRDIPAIEKAISPHWDKLKAAIETAEKISKVKRERIGFSVQAGAREPIAPGKARGDYEFKVLVDIRF